MRNPNGYHSSDLCRLVARDEVGGFVAHVQRHEGGHNTESGSHTEGRLSEQNVATTQEVEGGNSHHKHGASHVTSGNGVNELSLCPFVGEHCPEVRHFHTHCGEVEFRTDRIHHPSVSDQNPHSGEVRTNGHHNCSKEVLTFAETVPTEEEQTNKGGF